jgi:Xaa-Pro dipeptidase
VGPCVLKWGIMSTYEGLSAKATLEKRIALLVRALSGAEGGFDTALVVGRVNQYYLTGTMQNGVLALRGDGSYRFFVRKSFERARAESPLEGIVRMDGYRDMLSELPSDLGRTYIETEVMPLAMLERIRKYLKPSEILPLDQVLLAQRAVKDPDEVSLIEESGRLHGKLLETTVPSLLREGMSEVDLAAEMYSAMLKAGHHGLSRFSMFQMEMVIGQVGFGEDSLYPTNFDGPGGMLGMHPAVPILGSRERRLRKGDIVFADVGHGVLGYHSDKTQVYCFGAKPPAAAVQAHEACRAVLKKALGLLKPGVTAGEVYDQAMSDLPDCLSRNFMGYKESVKFLGHGVGLHIDEAPIIMSNNKAPLLENMVIALEPKCGIEGVGMVGVEETYLVTASGPKCLTGGDRGIVVV